MSLSWRRHRALCAIERGLAEQDPELVDRITGRPRAVPVAEWVGWSVFWVAVLLLAAGLLRVDSSLLEGGLLLLGTLPPLVLILVAQSRSEDRCRRWPREPLPSWPCGPPAPSSRLSTARCRTREGK